MIKKMMMFAASLASRGIGNKKADIETKQLRVVSCFGGGVIDTPCPYLRESSSKGLHVCGRCGCGDKPHTILLKPGDEYAKLDYPILNCPVQMPGFSNYDPNFVNPDIKHRKEQIESLDPEQLKLVSITINGT